MESLFGIVKAIPRQPEVCNVNIAHGGDHLGLHARGLRIYEQAINQIGCAVIECVGGGQRPQSSLHLGLLCDVHGKIVSL
ncbi:MAG: hypothetical protein WAK07_03875, partial [Rhodomicrobium sp.]